MNAKRQKLIKMLEELTQSDVYTFFAAGDSKYYSVGQDLVPIFTDVVAKREGKRRKNAILILETSGGEPTPLVSLVDLLKECYEFVCGYAFGRCYSAGTMGMFATDKIYMSKYAFFTPVDLLLMPDEKCGDLLPLVAYFNTYLNKEPTEREIEFEKKYPEKYLCVVTKNQYSEACVKPLIEKHCVEGKREEAWRCFNGGLGIHSVKLGRRKLRDMGIMVEDMPGREESIIYSIIDSYINDCNMLTSSIITSANIIEERNAYFETAKFAYVHYAKFKNMAQEYQVLEEGVDESQTSDEESDVNVATSKLCIESGWKIE